MGKESPIAWGGFCLLHCDSRSPPWSSFQLRSCLNAFCKRRGGAVPGPGTWAREPRFLSPVFGAPGGGESFPREEASLTSHSCSRFDPRSPPGAYPPGVPTSTHQAGGGGGARSGSLAGPRRAARRSVPRPAKAQNSTAPVSRSAGTPRAVPPTAPLPANERGPRRSRR